MKHNKGIIAIVLCISMLLTSIAPSFSLGEDVTVSSEETLLSDSKSSNEDETATISQVEEELSEDDKSGTQVEPEENTSTEASIETTTESATGVETETTEVFESEIATESETTETTETTLVTEASTETFATNSEIEIIIIATKSTMSVVEKTDVPMGTTPASTKKAKREFKPGFISPGFSVDIVDRSRIDNALFKAPELPAKYDSRDYQNEHGVDIVPPPRDQNPYGDCWAFAAIGAVETSIRSKNLITSPNDEGADLSELAVALFTIEGLDGLTDSSEYIDKPGVEGGDYCCLNYDYYMDVKHIPRASMSFADSGGNATAAYLIASTYMGFVSENDFPHTEANIKAIENEMRTTGLADARKPYAFNKNRYEVINADYLNKNDRDSVKEAIMKYGSVAIGYNENRDEYNCHVNDGEWYYLAPDKTYKILDDGSIGEEASLWANHAVTIIGWDDTVPFNYFYYDGDVYEDRDTYVIASYSIINDDSGKYYPTYRKEESRLGHDGAWLIRNSWGDDNDNANHGYFWLPYDDFNLDPVVVSVDVEAAGKHKYNYHYDTTSSLDYYDYGGTGKLANIFKVSSDMDQVLDAVNIAWRSANIDYDIQIYTSDNKMDDPEDGTLMLTQSVHSTSAGIKTIELDKSVLVKKDTYFSIVVKAKTPHAQIFHDITYVDVNSDRWCYNEVHLGESWENDNGSWRDLNTTPEVTLGDRIFGYTPRIRGLTDEARVITFNAGGGTGTMPDQGGKVNETVKINENKFTRNGYNFVKWVDDGGTEYDDGADIVLDKDITLTALWQYAGGGSSGSSGGDGGSGKGPIPQTPQSSTTSIDVNTVKTISAVVNNDTSTWIYDPTANKWKLNVLNANGQSLPLSNGFYIVNKTISTIVNGVSVPNVVNDTYYFDTSGNMVTGWVKTMDSKWYFFENAKTADEGKMVIGWKSIAGSWYYFVSDGSMLTNGRTPDGYLVGADGRYVA